MAGSSEDTANGLIVPNPSKSSEDVPGEVGNEANEIRFSKRKP
jgi:hypothetical protein